MREKKPGELKRQSRPKDGLINMTREALWSQEVFDAVVEENEARLSRALEHGGSPDALDRDGKVSALEKAARYGSESIVAALLAAGADPNLRTDQSFTALMAAAIEGHVGCARRLIEAGSEIDAENSSGWTAGALAVRKGSLECMELLARHGADPEARGRLGKTWMEIAKEETPWAIGWIQAWSEKKELESIEGRKTESSRPKPSGARL